MRYIALLLVVLAALVAAGAAAADRNPRHPPVVVGCGTHLRDPLPGYSAQCQRDPSDPFAVAL